MKILKNGPKCLNFILLTYELQILTLKLDKKTK